MKEFFLDIAKDSNSLLNQLVDNTMIAAIKEK
jgi:hypothetical protein